MFAGIAGGLIGANIAQLVATDSPGKSILGGISGGYLAVMAAKRYLGIVRPTGDLFALALAAGEAIGRWGCFLAGCCYGKPTESS
jgi:phosphatidylglycerol:prolipoprotein diacylglycerol transferase